MGIRERIRRASVPERTGEPGRSGEGRGRHDQRTGREAKPTPDEASTTACRDAGVDRALPESDRRFRAAFDNPAVGMAQVGADGRFLRVNRRFAEITGRTPQELAGLTFADITHPEDLDVDLSQAERLRRGEIDHYRTEKRYLRPDGSSVWVRRTASVQWDEEGRFESFVAVVEDMTDWREIEAELLRVNIDLEAEVGKRTVALAQTVAMLEAEIQRRADVEKTLEMRSWMLESFFAHTITPLAILDPAFNFVRVNAAYARAGATTPEALEGANHFERYPDADNQTIFERVLATGEPYEATARAFTYPDLPERGTTYWNWRLTPILDDAGAVSFLVLNLEDVTEQQRALEEAEARADELRRLAHELARTEERERRRLAGVLHDDVQQLLVAAKMRLTAVSAGRGSPSEREVSLTRTAELLDESIARTRSLSHQLRPPVLSQGTLEEALRWLAGELESQCGLRIDLDSEGISEPVEPESSRALLFYATRELLLNVAKHAGVAEARVSLRRAGDEVVVAVQDSGVGFDPDAPSETRGIGLDAIAERLRMLGGRLDLDSRPGHGTRTALHLPMRG